MLVGISCLLYQVIKDTAFVNFYISLCQERSRIVLEPNEDMGLVSINFVLIVNKYLIYFNK